MRVVAISKKAPYRFVSEGGKPCKKKKRRRKVERGKKRIKVSNARRDMGRRGGQEAGGDIKRWQGGTSSFRTGRDPPGSSPNVSRIGEETTKVQYWYRRAGRKAKMPQWSGRFGKTDQAGSD